MGNLFAGFKTKMHSLGELKPLYNFGLDTQFSK